MTTVEVKCQRVDKVGERYLVGFKPSGKETAPLGAVVGPGGFSLACAVEPPFQMGRTYEMTLKETE